MDFINYRYACDNVVLEEPTTKRTTVNRITTVLPSATEICDFIEQNNFSVVPKVISRNIATGVIGYFMTIIHHRRFDISKQLATALNTLYSDELLFKLQKCDQQLIVSPVSFDDIDVNEVNENILHYSEIDTIISWFMQKMDTDFEKLTEAEKTNIEKRGAVLFNNGKVIVQSLADETCTEILDYYKQNNLRYFINSDQLIRITFKYKNELIEYNYYEGTCKEEKYCFLAKYIAEELINQYLK